MSDNTSAYDDLSQAFQRHAETFSSISRRIEEAIQTIKSGALVGNPGMPLSDFIKDRILSESALLESTFHGLTTQMASTLPNSNNDLSLMHTSSASLANFCEQAFPPVSTALVSPMASKRVLSLLKFFPTTLATSILFESRLNRTDEQVDVSILINPNFDRGRDLLTHSIVEEFPNPSYIFESKGWEKIIHFCQRWADENALLNSRIASIWLEFDLLVDQNDDLPLPSLFFNFREPIDDNLLAVISEALCQFIDAQQVDIYLTTIKCITQALSHPLPISWVGVMCGRNSPNVRLYLELSPEEILAVLDELEWLNDQNKRQEALVDLRPRLTQLSELCDRLILDITLTESGIGQQIGVECGYRNSRQIQVEPRWRELLNMLVTTQLCTPEKADAVLSWSGYSVAEFTPLGKTRVALRKLSHIKLQYRPMSWQQAKIYFQYAAYEAAKQYPQVNSGT